MPEGNFNEVLAVSFDPSVFQQSLSSMVDQYTSFIQKLNGLGDGLKTPLSGSTDSGLNEQFASLSTQVEGLQSSINQLATGLTSGFEQAGQAASTMNSKIALDPGIVQQNKELVAQVVDAYIQGTSGIEALSQKSALTQTAIEEEKTARIIASVKQVADARNISDEAAIANLVKLATAQVEEGEKATSNSLKLIERETLARQKAADQQIATQQKRDVEMATSQGRTMAEEEKIENQLIAEGVKWYADAIAQKEALTEKFAVARLRAQEESLAVEEKISTQELALSAKTNETTSRAYAQYINEQHDLALKENQSRIKSAEETEAAIQKIRNDSSRAYAQYIDERNRNKKPVGSNPSNDVEEESGGLNGFVGSIPQAVAGLVKFQIAMAAINATVAIGLAPLHAFEAIISGGFKYQENLQNRSQDLQAALLQSVTYSKDFSENIRLSGIDAGILVKQIDDLSVKLRIGSDTLKVGFQSFLENGGRNLTRNNSEALDTSALITSAIQTQTKNPALLNRELANEMAKLMQGTVTSSDKLVTTLGISADKLKEIVANAKIYHDLNDEIIANSPGLVQRLKDAGDNQASLVATLDLYKARWEGLIAGPLFQQFTEILKSILDYLDKHKVDIEEMGRQLGIMVSNGAEFVKTFLQANWSGLVITFKDLAKLLVGMAGAVQFMASGAIGIAQAIESANQNRDYNLKVRGIDSTRSNSDDKAREDFNNNKINYSQLTDQLEKNKKIQQDSLAGIKDNSTNIVDIFKQFADNVSKGDKAVQSADAAIENVAKGVSGKNNNTANPPSDPKNNINTKAGKPTSPLGMDKADLAKELEAIKSEYEKYFNGLKELFAGGNITLSDFTNKTVSALQNEKLEVMVATSDAAAKVRASGVKNAPAAAQRIETQGDGRVDQLNDQISKATATENQDVYKAEQVAVKSIAESKMQAAQNEISKLKEIGASQVDIAIKEKELDDEKYKVEYESLNTQMNSTKNLTEYVTLLAKRNALEDAQAGKSHSDQTAIKVAAYREISGLTDEQIRKNDQQASIFKQQNDLQQQGYSYQRSISEQKQDQLILDNKLLDIAKNNLVLAEAELKAAKDLDPVKKQAAQDKVDAAKSKVTEATNAVQSDQPDIIKIVFNEDDISSLKDAFTSDFPQGIKDLTNAFGTFKNIVDDYTKGQKQGGLLGGIGGVLSGQGGQALGAIGDGAAKLGDMADNAGGALGGLGGALGGVSSVLGAAGPFISAIGPAFSIIGDLFTAAAKKTADEMKKQFAQIQTNYSDGSINLSQAITQEQNTITETISKLSGEKGGQGELDSILPGMQSDLASLEAQQKQIFVQMDQAVGILKLQQDYLGSALSSWNQINTQVTAYVNAGGSIAEAAQFISQSLEKQKQQAADDLIAAETSAVQDAQNYNNLLLQRTDLIKQYNEQAFGIKNKDSIERKQANAVTAASSLADATSAYQTQLLSDNQQITQLGQRVSAEQQIFGIATDTASLQKESNSLALQSLNQQVTQWQAIQAVYNGIVQTSSGLYTYTASLANLLGFTAGFGNDPSSSYLGATTPITGYTGPGTGTSAPVGVGYSAGGVGATAAVVGGIQQMGIAGLTLVNGALPVTFVSSTGATLSGFASPGVGGGATTFGSGAISSPIATANSSSTSTTIGQITVNITTAPGAVINGTTIATSIQDALVNRNQYSGSTYYG